MSVKQLREGLGPRQSIFARRYCIPTQIGTLTSNVHYNPVAPYLGLGAETPAMLGGHLVFSLDAGAMYQGRSNVTASAGGLAANYIAAEESLVKHYTDRLSFYPVVSVGAKYRF